MTPKLPAKTAKDIIRILKKKGFEFDRQSGSHAVFIDQDGKRVTVPIHSNRDLGKGLLKQIMKDADIKPSEL